MGKMEDPEADDCSNSTGPIVLEDSPSSPNDSKMAGNFEKSHSKCSVCLEPTDNNHLHMGPEIWVCVFGSGYMGPNIWVHRQHGSKYMGPNIWVWVFGSEHMGPGSRVQVNV